jgi:hypothetical protein
MKTRIKWYVLILTISTITATGQSKASQEDKLYDDLRTISGRVKILNHPTLGKTEGRNLQLLFQRTGCKRCVISVRTDSEGSYSLTVSKGNYRIVALAPKVTNGEFYDLLSPSQRRTVDATSEKTVVDFDIEVVLPD